ncbi:MAG: hypothetical protein ACJ72N_16870 [Labedaea sp.]
MPTRSATVRVICVMALVVTLVACGAANDAARSASGVNAPGDIPDSQLFVPFTTPDRVVTVKVPGDEITVRRAGLSDATVRVDGVVDLPLADSLFQTVGAAPTAQPAAPPDNVLLLPAARWHALFDPVASVRPDQVRHPTPHRVSQPRNRHRLRTTLIQHRHILGSRKRPGWGHVTVTPNPDSAVLAQTSTWGQGAKVLVGTAWSGGTSSFLTNSR